MRFAQAKTSVVALAAVAVLAAGCGAAATESTAGQPSSQPAATQPASSLTAFEQAVSGPQSQAFSAQLDATTQAAGSAGTQAVWQACGQLAAAAGDWLAVLHSASPPPAYQGIENQLVNGVGLIQKGSTEVAAGIQDGNQAAISQGITDFQNGSSQVQQAAGQVPQSWPGRCCMGQWPDWQGWYGRCCMGRMSRLPGAVTGRAAAARRGSGSGTGSGTQRRQRCADRGRRARRGHDLTARAPVTWPGMACRACPA